MGHPKNQTLSFDMPYDMGEQIRQYAKDEGLSISHYIKRLITGSPKVRPTFRVCMPTGEMFYLGDLSRAKIRMFLAKPGEDEHEHM